MTLYAKIESDMKTAMKDKDVLRLSVLRLLLSGIRKVEMDRNDGKLQDADAFQVLQKQVKQHRDSIQQFTAGGRKDLADKEAAELKILETYLPDQISEDELTSIVRSVITETGYKAKADMGKVMKLVMEKSRGACDGRLVSRIVASLLQ